MKLFKFIATVAFLVSAGMLYAFPEAPVHSLKFRPDVYAFDNGYEFEGIVKLSNCSGSLVILEGQNMNAKGLVLTNGHCVPKGIFGGLIGPNEIIINKSVKRQFKLFKDIKTLFTINSTRIVYAAMNQTDMALYELDESYQQILNRTGVSPLILSSQRPTEGTQIEIISGYWERGYSCRIDQFVFKMQEGDYFFKDSVRYFPGCNTIGGTSGSPVIDAQTRQVIAVNNTGNEGGRKCSMNNPCEINERGEIFAQKGLAYGQQTYQVYSCLNEAREFVFNKRGCQLAAY